jgi:hypothetical protein
LILNILCVIQINQKYAYDISKLFTSMHKHDVDNHINEPYLKIVKYFKTSHLKKYIKILKLLHKHHLNIEVELNIVNLNYDFPYETCSSYEKLEI